MSNNVNALALLKKDTVDVVSTKIRSLIESNQLHLPPDYSAENALKAAWLDLQGVTDKGKQPVLQVCTRDSIANSLLDMVILGLNPAKKQGYFIAYGKRLAFQPSYFGDMAVVKRILPKAEIYYDVVYEGDEFVYEIVRGRKQIIKHVQEIGNVKPDKIVAAYCIIEPGDDQPARTEIMTWQQIQQSWKHSQTYRPDGKSGPHHEHPDQMALRTVIRRACKPIINSSSDDYLFLQSYNRADDYAEDDMDAEVADNANGEVIDVQAEVVPPEPAPEASGDKPQAPTEEQTSGQAELGPGF